MVPTTKRVYIGLDLLVLLAFNKRNTYKLVRGHLDKAFIALQLGKALVNIYKALDELQVYYIYMYTILGYYFRGVA